MICEAWGKNDNLGDLDMENLYSWEILGKIVADIIVVKFCLVSKQYIELWLEMTLPETHSQFAHENGWDWKIKSPFLFWFRPIFQGRAVSFREGILMYLV